MANTAVVVLTLNEERYLGRCLAQIPKRYPVYVVDSGSSDGTRELAAELGATVLENDWHGFAAQRNFAISTISDFDWLLFVDADELYPQRFFTWLDEVDRTGVDVYQVSSRIVLGGTVLKRAPAYPIYHPRLVRTATTVFINSLAGHGETVIDGLKIGHVDIPYEHHVTDIGMTAWMSKHVRLARMEVDAEAQPPAERGRLTWRRRVSGLMGRSILRIPLRFVFHYFVVGGVLDGRAGLRYSMMYTWFEFSKWLSREG